MTGGDDGHRAYSRGCWHGRADDYWCLAKMTLPKLYPISMFIPIGKCLYFLWWWLQITHMLQTTFLEQVNSQVKHQYLYLWDHHTGFMYSYTKAYLDFKSKLYFIPVCFENFRNQYNNFIFYYGLNNKNILFAAFNGYSERKYPWTPWSVLCTYIPKET